MKLFILAALAVIAFILFRNGSANLDLQGSPLEIARAAITNPPPTPAAPQGHSSLQRPFDRTRSTIEKIRNHGDELE